MSSPSKAARLAGAAVVCAGLGAAAGCASILDLDELQKVGCAEGCDGGSVDAIGAPGDAGPPNGSCAGGRGASRVGVPLPDGGGFCIDATEVTNAEYAAFLAAGAVSSSLPDACRGRSDHTPSANWPYPAGAGDLPVVYVDWCDAWAYCAWAGEAMCGGVPGAPTNAPAGGSQSRWFLACAGPSSTSFPYGSSYVAGTCNDHSDAATPATAPSSCMGGFAGLMDMSGNVAEWDSWCSSSGGSSPWSPSNPGQCIARGGSFASGNAAQDCTCGSFAQLDRNGSFPDVGIRCCSP